MASRQKCCVPKCNVTRHDNVTLHSFPNPEKDPARFRSWLYAIGGDILAMDNNHIYKQRKICHNHFEEKYRTWTKILSPNAIPTLYLPGLSRIQRPLSDISDKLSTEPNVAPKLMEPSTSTCKPVSENPVRFFPEPSKITLSIKSTKTKTENIEANVDHTYIIKRKIHTEHSYTKSPNSDFNWSESKRISIKPSLAESHSVNDLINEQLHLTEKTQDFTEQSYEPVEVDTFLDTEDLASTIEETEAEVQKPEIFSWEKSSLVPVLQADDTDSVILHEEFTQNALVDNTELSMYCDDVDKKRGNDINHNDQAEQPAEFQCNDCNNFIVGFRYTCVQCADFDLCSSCEARGAHDQHYVLRIPGPRPYTEVQSVLERIRRELLDMSVFVTSHAQLDIDGVKEEVKEEQEMEEACDPIYTEADANSPEPQPSECRDSPELVHRTEPGPCSPEAQPSEWRGSPEPAHSDCGPSSTEPQPIEWLDSPEPQPIEWLDSPEPQSIEWLDSPESQPIEWLDSPELQPSECRGAASPAHTDRTYEPDATDSRTSDGSNHTTDTAIDHSSIGVQQPKQYKRILRGCTSPKLEEKKNHPRIGVQPPKQYTRILRGCTSPNLEEKKNHPRIGVQPPKQYKRILRGCSPPNLEKKDHPRIGVQPPKQYTRILRGCSPPKLEKKTENIPIVCERVGYENRLMLLRTPTSGEGIVWRKIAPKIELVPKQLQNEVTKLPTSAEVPSKTVKVLLNRLPEQDIRNITLDKR